MNTVYVWENDSITIMGMKRWPSVIIHGPKWKRTLVKGEMKTRKRGKKKKKENLKAISS